MARKYLSIPNYFKTTSLSNNTFRSTIDVLKYCFTATSRFALIGTINWKDECTESYFSNDSGYDVVRLWLVATLGTRVVIRNARRHDQARFNTGIAYTNSYYWITLTIY